MGLSAQQILGNDPEYLQRQLAQQEIQKYQNFQNPQLGLAATSGALLGRGIANLFQGRGFFEVSDPSLRRVSEVNSIISQGLQGIDPTDPTASANAYASIARQLAAAGYAQPAALAAAEASKMTATLEAGKKISSTYQLKGGGALYEKAGRLYKMDDTPVTSNEVEVIIKDPLGNILGKPPGAPTAAAGDGKKGEKPKGDIRASLFPGQTQPGTTPATTPSAPPATSASGFAESEAALAARNRELRDAEKASRQPKAAASLTGQALVDQEYKEIEAGTRQDFSPEAKKFLGVETNVVPTSRASAFEANEAAAEAERKRLRAAEKASREPKAVKEPPAPKSKEPAKTATKQKESTKSKVDLPTDEDIEDGESGWVVRNDVDPKEYEALLLKEMQEMNKGKRKTYSDKLRSFFERA